MANRVKLVPTIGAEIPNHDFTLLLGPDSATSLLYTDKDAGKAIKLVADSRAQICADGDEIGGQLITVEAQQTSGGFRIGTCRSATSPLFDAKVVGATLVIGDEVVAAAQAAPGVPNDTPPYHVRMRVKKAATANGQRLKVVAIQSGTGAAGSVVTLSKMF